MKSNSNFSLDPGAERLIRQVTPPTFTHASQEDLFDSVDNRTVRPNDRRMTDINRQQVADMLSASEAKVDARLANFDTSVKTGFADVKTGFAELKTEMQKMRGDFEKQSHDSTKWIIGSVFGMISLGVAIIGVMINLNKGEKPAPAAQAAPIVITIPGAAAVPPQAPAPAQPRAK